jgi:putative transcriptional regulator
VLALGHAGWGAGQLEQELLENAWLVGEPDFGLLFGQDNASKWTRALARIGVDPARLSAVAGHA